MLSGKAAYIRVGTYKSTRECKRPLLFSLSLSRTDRPRSGRPRAAVTAVRVEKIGEMVGERLRRNLGPRFLYNLEV